MEDAYLLGGQWKKIESRSKPGRYYYYNKETKERSWTLPECVTTVGEPSEVSTPPPPPIHNILISVACLLLRNIDTSRWLVAVPASLVDLLVIQYLYFVWCCLFNSVAIRIVLNKIIMASQLYIYMCVCYS